MRPKRWATGEILSQSRCPIRIDQPRVSFAEIDTDRLWLLVQQVIRSEVNEHPGITFDAIGVSAMLGYVFLDKANQPLMPAITYADNRATVETEEIRQLFPDEKFFAITGRKPSPLLLAPKIMWLVKHRSDAAKKLARLFENYLETNTDLFQDLSEFRNSGIGEFRN